jgi:hypothetical protein
VNVFRIRLIFSIIAFSKGLKHFTIGLVVSMPFNCSGNRSVSSLSRKCPALLSISLIRSKKKGPTLLIESVPRQFSEKRETVRKRCVIQPTIAGSSSWCSESVP